MGSFELNVFYSHNGKICGLQEGVPFLVISVHFHPSIVHCDVYITMSLVEESVVQTVFFSHARVILDSLWLSLVRTKITGGPDLLYELLTGFIQKHAFALRMMELNMILKMT